MSLSLPQNINLLTFEPWTENTVLVRFEHILERDEDPAAYSKPVTFNLRDAFAALHIAEVHETTLAANQWIEEAVRFSFKEETTPTEFMKANHLPASSRIGESEERNGNIKMTINLDPFGSETRQQSTNTTSRSKRDKNNSEYLTFYDRVPKPAAYGQHNDDPFVITLEAMQIRTFVLTLDEQ